MKHVFLITILFVGLFSVVSANGPQGPTIPELMLSYDYSKNKIIFSPATPNVDMSIKIDERSGNKYYTIRLTPHNQWDPTTVKLIQYSDSYQDDGVRVKRMEIDFLSMQYGDSKRSFKPQSGIIVKRTGSEYVQRMLLDGKSQYKAEYDPTRSVTTTSKRINNKMVEQETKTGHYPMMVKTSNGSLVASVNYNP